MSKICKACRSAELVEPKDNHPSYLTCPNCRAIQLTYIPLPHQEAFHADPAKIRMFAGGYGSGKTRTSVQEVLMLALENPGTSIAMTAATLQQLRDTSMSMFYKDVCPPPLILEEKKQEGKTILINGTEVLWRPSDDEGKLRSLNLGVFHMEEASEQKYDIFVQLMTRLRDTRMKKHRAILSTNPDLGWVKTEILLRAGKITGGTVDYSLHKVANDPDIAVHVVETAKNIYLPADFESSLTKNKPQWWIDRYLRGSFEHAEGAVYPNFGKTVIEPFEIPRHWNHYRVALDHGLRNPTAVVFLAVNPFKTDDDFRKPIVVQYDEHYEAGQLVPHHARIVRDKLNNIPIGASIILRIDPAQRNRDAITGKSVMDYYLEHGLAFQPANNNLDYGLSKVNTYIESGALKIFNTCRHTIEEGLNYKYPEQELVDDKNPDEKPRKYKDHAMDALRYAIVDLPDDPRVLYETGGYAPPPGHKLRTVTKDGELLVHEIEDEEDFDSTEQDWLSYC